MAPSKRKLIFFWTYTNWGGAQIYFLAIMKLAREEWDIIVCLPRTSKPDLLRFLDQLCVPYEFLDWSFDPRPERTLAGRIKRQAARIRSEFKTLRYLQRFEVGKSVLHIEVAPWQSWILLLFLSLRGANVFATLHNFHPDAPAWRRAVWKLRFQIVSRLPRFHIFASNRDTKENLKGFVTPEFLNDIKVTYTSVDPEEIVSARSAPLDRAAERKVLGISSEAFVVLAVGQFIDRKGRWTFLEAAKRAVTVDPNIVFVWVMPETPTVEENTRIAEFGLGESFIPILSSTIGSDRLSILRSFRIGDIFALPSFVEGLPIALLEAMALGLPSISTNVYAIPETVVHEDTGLLIEAGDSSALAASILRLRSDNMLREKLSRSGASFVLERFDERVAASICIDSYRRCFQEI